jgi:hypothetical protein
MLDREDFDADKLVDECALVIRLRHARHRTAPTLFSFAPLISGWFASDTNSSAFPKRGWRALSADPFFYAATGRPITASDHFDL